jgi:hypothetical protein
MQTQNWTVNPESTERASPVEMTLSQLAEGTVALADVQSRCWSSTQLLLLALVLPAFPMPEDQSPGDAWRKLDDRQRAVVRRFHPYVAHIVEREVKATGEIHGSGGPPA